MLPLAGHPSQPIVTTNMVLLMQSRIVKIIKSIAIFSRQRLAQGIDRL